MPSLFIHQVYLKSRLFFDSTEMHTALNLTYSSSVLQSLLHRARGSGSSSRRVSLFKNVEPSGKSLADTSRRLQTPLVNFNPFTPDSLLIQSATQQRNRKRAHWNE